MFCRCVCFFFFKQKTAYEMRISDWSSDVCSSDLVDLAHVVMQQHIGGARRVDPEPGPDDAGAGEMGLHHLGLEVLVEEFADRHGPEADRLGHLALAEVVKALAEIQQFGEDRKSTRLNSSH